MVFQWQKKRKVDRKDILLLIIVVLLGLLILLIGNISINTKIPASGLARLTYEEKLEHYGEIIDFSVVGDVIELRPNKNFDNKFWTYNVTAKNESVKAVIMNLFLKDSRKGTVSIQVWNGSRWRDTGDMDLLVEEDMYINYDDDEYYTYAGSNFLVVPLNDKGEFRMSFRANRDQARAHKIAHIYAREDDKGSSSGDLPARENDQGSVSEDLPYCEVNATNVKASMNRTVIEIERMMYDYAYSIEACKDEVRYKMYLEGMRRTYYESGMVARGEEEIISEVVESSEDFRKLCIRIYGDDSFGSEGLECFYSN